MKKLFHRITYLFLYEMKLSQKLMASYALLIILPMIVFTILSHRHVSATLLEQFQQSSHMSTEQTCTYLDRIINDLIESTEKTAFSTVLPDILKHDAVTDLNIEVYSNFLTAKNLVNSIINSDSLYSVELFIDSSIYYARPTREGKPGLCFVSLETPEGQEMSEQLQNHLGEILWSPSKTIENLRSKEQIPVITGTRYIKDNVGHNNLGLLAINISQNYVNSIITRAAILPDSLVLLLDQAGNVISCSSFELYEKYHVSPKYLLSCIAGKQDTFYVEHRKMSLTSYDLVSAPWTVAVILPYDEILKTSNATRDHMLLMMALITVLFFLLAYYISRSITRRIHFLSQRMQEVEFDNYSFIATIEGNDEVSQLIRSYNYMFEKINAYTTAQYQLGLKLKNSELKTMQAQINPHFLYNTLDLIRWLALDYNSPEISEIVLLLSKFYRLSLNKGVDFVTIKETLQHIEIYIKLYNYRFDVPITLNIEVDPQLDSYKILKLLFQPIVENSILHGIYEKSNKTGTITIRGKKANNKLHFEISDDGVGMTPEQINRLFEDTSDTSGGYGIMNVQERIKLFYGQEYGLSFTSTTGIGTTVTLTVPILE